MTDATFTLTATKRSGVGRGASRRLRYADQVPAIVYGAGKEPQNITINHRSLVRALENEAFYSHILTLELDGKTEKVVLKDIQRHPYRPSIMHIDLQRVSADEKLTMLIPLHFMGADVAPGVKQDGGVVSHLLSEVEVRCLPADLPEYIEVDIAQLKLNETIHLSGLKLPKGVEIVALAHGEDKPVVTIYIPRAIVEPVEEVTPETIVEGAAPEEGEEGKEGKEGKEGRAGGAAEAAGKKEKE